MKNNVRKVRLYCRMTQEDLSQASGVPVSTISGIERGADPRMSTAKMLAKALRARLDDLW